MRATGRFVLNGDLSESDDIDKRIQSNTNLGVCSTDATPRKSDDARTVFTVFIFRPLEKFVAGTRRGDAGTPATRIDFMVSTP